MERFTIISYSLDEHGVEQEALVKDIYADNFKSAYLLIPHHIDITNPLYSKIAINKTSRTYQKQF